ncbi:hypothetical protein GCM10010172_76300 [Paractinoplanes ferrugineus]|uniref:Uncharacterized protein n=1 Tax=Paractinoplanes ferrugineus TaxID=113564 RepID=A0A919IY56_9ACTN|nr:hypothetical protein [Actinoplanes ferrugineus]GIE11216.1 hypothetical protein Afe05nite_30560 [Actinoplanes ferrugineus]
MNLVVRFRLLFAAVVGAVLAVVTRGVPPDLTAFAAAASRLLHGRFAEVYAEAWNQAGPVQLLISRLLVIGAGRDGTPSIPLAAAVGAAFVAGTMWCCRGSLPREAVGGGLALMWVATALPWNGHPAETAIPLLWAYAVKQSRRDRNLAAATLLALAVAVAPWAILGVPCLLAAAPLRRALPTGALAAALGVACYLPFVLTGHFAMFAQRWGISAGTLPTLLGLPDVTWSFRLAQGAAVAAGVALVARLCRTVPQAVAIVPLAATLLRVATDPVYYPYYFFPVAVASLLLVTLSTRRLPLAAAIGYLALLAASGNWIVWGSLTCLALLLLATVKAAKPSTAPHLPLSPQPS